MKWLNKLKKVLIFTLLITLFLTSLSYAAKNPINGSIVTSGVKIELNKYTLNTENKRVPAVNIEGLQPNQVVDYIITVTNKKAPAYVRVKIDYDATFAIDDSVLGEIQANWVKKGDYYYYTKALDVGESVDFCRKIRIPNLQSSDGDKFTVIANADAVQEQNFDPDFTSNSPWGGILIEASIGDGEYRKGEDGGFELRFNNGLEGVVNKTHLFEDFGTVMPGDTRTDSLRVINSMYKDLRIVIKSVNNPENEAAWENKINLKIRRGKNLIYDGYLFDKQLKSGVNVGAFDRQTNEQIDFEITLDKSLANDSSFSRLDVVWELNATFYTKGGSGGGNGGGGHVVPMKDNNSAPEVLGVTRPVEDVDMSEVGYLEPVTTDSTRKISGGHWVLIDEEHHKWNYVFKSNNLAKDGWFYIENPYAKDTYGEYAWFKFDTEGVMQFGWIQHDMNPAIWYYAHEYSDGNLGVLMKGWHYDPQDNHIYYLDLTTYVMKEGYQTIDGKQYYFHMSKDTSGSHWLFGKGIDFITNSTVYKWFYTVLGGKSYGSMYQNEYTPDGRWADSNGVIRNRR